MVGRPSEVGEILGRSSVKSYQWINSFWTVTGKFLVIIETLLYVFDRLVGLVVKASASRAEDPEFETRLRRDFFGVESYQ